MTDHRIEMTLEVNGEVRVTAYPLRNHESIMKTHKQWYYFYGLASVRNWQIYITHKSPMKESKPFRIYQEFPYYIKSQKQQDESDITESRAASLYCEPVNFAGGLVKTIGRGQGPLL